MSEMERFVRIKGSFYYDALLNKIVKSDKVLKQHIKSNNCYFIPFYDNDFLQSNIEANRQQLILSVTETCNFRCEYCAYYDNRYDVDVPLVHITFGTAKIAIDDYIAHSYLSERRCISFYGGEPLLNFDLIKECVSYVESLNLTKPILYLFTTNGTTLTEEIARYAYDKKFIVNISLDGPKTIHDRYRKDLGGNDTFHRIINIAKFLVDLDPEYWKKSVHFFGVLAPPIDIKSLLDFFEVSPYAYSMSDMSITNHMKKYLSEHVSESSETIQPERIEYKAYLRQYNAMADASRKVRKVLQRNVITGHHFSPGSYCFPFVHRLFVSAGGDYYICEKYDQKEEYSFGNVYDGIDTQKLLALQQTTMDFHNKNCKQCWAVRLCGVCFASLHRYPECCDEYKNAALANLINVVEEDYEQ